MPDALHLEDGDAHLLAGALRTSHTWLLDAMGSCIERSNQPALARNLVQRDAILRLLAELGQQLDDSYRMDHLRAYAERSGVEFGAPHHG